MHIILALLGLAVAFAALRVLFWIVLWIAVQPLHLALRVLVWLQPRAIEPPPSQPFRVIQGGRR